MPKKTVRIYGLARNLGETPPVTDPDTEVWVSNYHRSTYGVRLPRLKETHEWTRWFNLHSKKHMQYKYPAGYKWYAKQSKPIYLQRQQPDIPASLAFPREAIQAYFGGPQRGSPGRYFVCSAAWLIALAIMEGFERIELWGFRLSDKPIKPHECYKFERPCIFYWIQQARDRGIEVTYPREVHKLPFEPGDPATYNGPLYGYSTTPDDNWDVNNERWL